MLVPHETAWSISHSLTSEAMLKLTQAFVSTGLNYCNSVLAGVSSQLLQKIQVIQNAAARFVTEARRRDHMAMVLREIRWLPEQQRIRFKTVVMVCHDQLRAAMEMTHSGVIQCI